MISTTCDRPTLLSFKLKNKFWNWISFHLNLLYTIHLCIKQTRCIWWTVKYWNNGQTLSEIVSYIFTFEKKLSIPKEVFIFCIQIRPLISQRTNTVNYNTPHDYTCSYWMNLNTHVKLLCRTNMTAGNYLSQTIWKTSLIYGTRIIR